jgi:hypothetical protein
MQGSVLAGFLLLSSSLKPILMNRVAAEILIYPERPEARKNPDEFLAKQNQFNAILTIAMWTRSGSEI